MLSMLLGRKETVKCDSAEEKQYISTPVLAIAKAPYSKLWTKLCLLCCQSPGLQPCISIQCRSFNEAAFHLSTLEYLRGCHPSEIEVTATPLSSSLETGKMALLIYYRLLFALHLYVWLGTMCWRPCGNKLSKESSRRCEKSEICESSFNQQVLSVTWSPSPSEFCCCIC